MRYKLLGRSGLRVSELALGTMPFGPEWGWGAGREESRRIFDAYAEAGGNFIDTANRYTEGTSERYVGEFVGHGRAAEGAGRVERASPSRARWTRWPTRWGARRRRRPSRGCAGSRG